MGPDLDRYRQVWGSRSEENVIVLVVTRETIEVETATSAEHTPKEQSGDSYTSVFQQKTVRNVVKTKLAD